ncbi:hypothetical protein ABH916_002785 [Peribacillus frigoritolerans]
MYCSRYWPTYARYYDGHACQPTYYHNKKSVCIFGVCIGSGGIDFDITLFIRDIYWMGLLLFIFRIGTRFDYYNFPYANQSPSLFYLGRTMVTCSFTISKINIPILDFGWHVPSHARSHMNTLLKINIIKI